MKVPQQIIKRPLLTEKGTSMADLGKYLFEVELKSNKIEIRWAVEKIYNVKVQSVRTQIIRGKFKRQGRNIGKRPNWKRAVVTLSEGAKIDFFAPI